MCGIAGLVHWNRTPACVEELEAMAGLLRHRGPDEQCAAMPEPGIGLVHTRLRVIDLSDAARQPMADDSQRVWLVFNGEVYNFQPLRRELEAAGWTFRSTSDTEVILRAYQQWGAEAIRRLDGMFALAIWDGRSRELLLARDRVGKKPLFYWTDGRSLVFGSEIKALFAHAATPCAVDEAVLPFVLALGYPPTGQTAYRQIAQVPPATWLRFRDGDPEPVVERYWSLRVAPAGQAGSRGDAARGLREALTDAVRRRLVSDVPLGAFLSGGIDSTIVAGLMAGLTGQPVKTFSIGFEGDPRYNETAYAQAAATRFGTDHRVFTVTPQSFELLERLVWHHDQPFGDSSAIPVYLLSELTRRHVTVALTGDGGDELFAGYTRFLAARWAERMPRPALRLAWSLLERTRPGRERSRLAQARRFAAVARLPLPERYLQWIAYWRQPPVRPLGPAAGSIDALHPSLRATWEASRGGSVLARLLDLNFHEYLPNDLLVKADRCSMAHGLELRSPLLDTALIERAAAMPDAWKAGWLSTKRILREACADLLPESIQRRGKMGFGVPLGTWFRGRWRQPLQDLLEADQARLHRYVDRDVVRQTIARHLRGEEDAGHRLWLLLTLEVWLRRGRPSAGVSGASARWLARPQDAGTAPLAA